MPMSSPMDVPENLPNVARLIDECKEAIGTLRNTPLNQEEMLALSWLVGRSLRPVHGDQGHTTDFWHHVYHDFWIESLPRYTALFAMMRPYSLITQHPNTVIHIAQFICGDTYDQVMQDTDWQTIQLRCPDVKLNIKKPNPGSQ